MFYYVYCYADPRNKKPFYIGKGKGRRKYIHLRPSRLSDGSAKSSAILDILESGHEPIICELRSNLSEEDALRLERDFIQFFGKDHLTNKTLGGQGVAGFAAFIGRNHTDEAKEKIRQSKIGPKNPMYGKTRSEDALRKFRQNHSGDKHHSWGKERPVETKEKIRQSLQGRKLSQEQKEQRRASMIAVWEKRRNGSISPRKTPKKPAKPNRPGAKLTENEVREIRLSNETVIQLAARYNVDGSVIRRIINRQSWKDVE